MTYSVSELIREDGFDYYNVLAHDDLMVVSPGQTVTASISWDGSALTFGADGNQTTYTPQGTVKPPTNPYRSLTFRINFGPEDTTPTFTWDPVSGANRYRVGIHNNDRSKTLWRGYVGNQTFYTVPPGALLPNSAYRYRIYARDTHSPLDIDNRSWAPQSLIRFFTGAESVDPFIDLDSHGVHTGNDAESGSGLSFWIRVHDSQGVPGNIKSVKITHPGGAEEELIYSDSNPYSPPTGVRAESA